MENIIYTALVICSYLAGSIPFGLLFTKAAGLGDIRNIGSGNIGATNVMRTGNKKLALATLFCDAVKGVVVIIIAKQIDAPGEIVSLCGLFAVVGHVFQVWLKFKGGKGVATTLAVYLALYLPLGIFACIAWLAAFYISRMSSFSSISSIILANTVSIIMGGDGLFFITLIITVIVVYKHKENIERIMSGKEKAFTKSTEA